MTKETFLQEFSALFFEKVAFFCFPVSSFSSADSTETTICIGANTMPKGKNCSDLQYYCANQNKSGEKVFDVISQCKEKSYICDEVSVLCRKKCSLNLNLSLSDNAIHGYLATK